MNSQSPPHLPPPNFIDFWSFRYLNWSLFVASVACPTDFVYCLSINRFKLVCVVLCVCVRPSVCVRVGACARASVGASERACVPVCVCVRVPVCVCVPVCVFVCVRTHARTHPSAVSRLLLLCSIKKHSKQMRMPPSSPLPPRSSWPHSYHQHCRYHITLIATREDLATRNNRSWQTHWHRHATPLHNNPVCGRLTQPFLLLLRYNNKNLSLPGNLEYTTVFRNREKVHGNTHTHTHAERERQRERESYVVFLKGGGGGGGRRRRKKRRRQIWLFSVVFQFNAGAVYHNPKSSTVRSCLSFTQKSMLQ